MPVARILSGMEEDGIRLDHAFLDKLSVEFAKTMEDLENQAMEIAGETFNIASPKQVGEILFDKLGIKGGKKLQLDNTAPVKVFLKKLSIL